MGKTVQNKMFDRGYENINPAYHNERQMQTLKKGNIHMTNCHIQTIQPPHTAKKIKKKHK
jgi:hypothetical protein